MTAHELTHTIRNDMPVYPGTEQPKPMSIGTKLRPDRPMRRSSLSITKATRAM